MFTKLCAASLMALSLTSTAFADDSGWSGEASLAGSKTTGNTKTTDIGAAVKLKKESDLWRHKFNASADYGKVSGAQNKNRFDLGYQLDRDLNDRLYVYGNGSYFQDEFGAYKDGYFIGTGLGYKAVLPAPISWNLEGGIGYRSQKVRLAAGTPGGFASERNNDIAVRTFSDFDFKLNENVSLYNDTELTWSDSDTYIWNDTGITAQLMGNLAARASFRVDHHTDVPVGFKKTDTVTRVGVVYTIK
ncbi:MAG: DUF481 domain-containing protein [Alphaproteobacteria bacterium]